MKKHSNFSAIGSEQLLDRLRFENPWWISGLIDEDMSELQKRLYFDLFFPLIQELDIKRAVVLMGPRRVGKTVMMHHAIEELIKSGIDKKKICFISIDNPIYLNTSLEQLFSLARKAVGSGNHKGWYVFFDEIQYLKDWAIHLKVLVDSYPQTKFIVSGSASAALRLKSSESGAGRFTEFLLPPLTFYEYIHLIKAQNLVLPKYPEWTEVETVDFTAVNLRELNKHFSGYINFGGYPEVALSEKIQANPGRYIKNDIIDKVLLRDLPSLYGIRDVQELNSFFTYIAYYSGNEFSLDALSSSSGVEKNLLKKYLEYLEAAFLIKVIHRVDDSAKRFNRATFYKIYLTNPSLRSALFSPLLAADDFFGNMVETAIYAQWFHRDWFTPWYARWNTGRVQGEVDMVGLDEKKLKPLWALEIKWSNRYYEKPSELKSLLQFCQKNNLNSALVTTYDKDGTVIYNGIHLTFVPSALYAYTIGANTIKQKKTERGIAEMLFPYYRK
ncbi:MAG: ATP-binding protein [Ignavibacteriales bacterium]|nr:ATP-binding protein [Ignavibacteriales bacterium]